MLFIRDNAFILICPVILSLTTNGSLFERSFCAHFKPLWCGSEALCPPWKWHASLGVWEARGLEWPATEPWTWAAGWQADPHTGADRSIPGIEVVCVE